MAVKAILHSRDILTWCAIKFSYPDSVTRTTLSLCRPIAVPQLLLVTSGGKQWRDVEHENGSAFVAGNCLSFCYFAASKSQTSADILGQAVTCRGNSYRGDDVFLPRLYFRELPLLSFNSRSTKLLFSCLNEGSNLKI